MNPSVVHYKSVSGIDLETHVFKPDGYRGNRPAIVHFVCGNWNGFDPIKAYPQCEYYASRGMVCFSTQVRVVSQGFSPLECVLDARSAFRWVREHATDYGVDPDRLCAMGGSAGGHVSACSALCTDSNDPDDDPAVPAEPNLLVLFNPALVIYHSMRRITLFGGAERARNLSPVLRVTNQAPPAILFHGESDDVVIPEESLVFQRAMKKQDVECVVKLYPSEGHGFCNYFDGNNALFFRVHMEVDRFLQGKGWVKGPETIRDFMPSSPVQQLY